MSSSAEDKPNPSALLAECRERPSDDPIFALAAEADRRAAAGEDVLNATLGALYEEHGTIATMSSVHEALASLPRERVSAYAPIAGHGVFLEAVLRELWDDEQTVQRSCAVATPGGTGALYSAIVNFLGPGDALLTSSYYWSPYAILAEHSRRRVETFGMFDGQGRFDVLALEQALLGLLAKQGRALLLLNTPCHNPTGYSLDQGEWGALAQVLRRAARKGPITLLLDNAYAKFAAETVCDWRPFARELAEEISVLVAWTASKSFALYGGRVGALVSLQPDGRERARVQSALSFTCRGTWSNGNSAGQLAVAKVLSERALCQRWTEERQRLVGLLSARVQRFKQLASAAGLEFPRYEGGFFVSVFSDNARDLCQRMQTQGVFVVPLQGAVRVALCAVPLSRVARLVDTLAQASQAQVAPMKGRN